MRRAWRRPAAFVYFTLLGLLFFVGKVKSTRFNARR
jgi:hypothetical protein